MCWILRQSTTQHLKSAHGVASESNSVVRRKARLSLSGRPHSIPFMAAGPYAFLSETGEGNAIGICQHSQCRGSVARCWRSTVGAIVTFVEVCAKLTVPRATHDGVHALASPHAPVNITVKQLHRARVHPSCTRPCKGSRPMPPPTGRLVSRLGLPPSGGSRPMPSRGG